ncbi:MAG TPA: DUF3071 domain-containing protein [Candidatus Corynebacterium intestinavium]|uniref:DUF3071 domain-containing protein n=1 Tax=Candidatus Corynebacterium intestinavium TaxID=2838531 RepID=A0A9D2UBX7_9CORY|nr:DUF3071 domain-containing protein [Candidatus Corynebacterium intestinavium]
MRELKLVTTDSDAQSLVFVPAEATAGAEPAEEFFLAVTDELRELLGVAEHGSEQAADAAGVPEANTEDAGAESSDASEDDAGSGTSGDGLAAAFSELRENESRARAERERARHTEQESADEERVRKGFGTKAGSGRPHRTRIALSPRIIQDRVRHGASIAELAEEADTDESRIEPYAWPILQERSRIAELARSARPATSEGTSEHTLWEALATAFAAREENVADTQWDAHQDQSRQWVVTVSWAKAAAGQTNTHSAEFLFEPSATGGHNLVHPLDSVARDLVDPRFSQPVRSVTPLHPVENAEKGGGHPAAGAHDLFANTQGGTTPELREEDQRAPEQGNAPASGEAAESGAEQGKDFLLHPTGEQGKKRRRKAVTPHWEDVLLGVRTNPKKKR